MRFALCNELFEDRDLESGFASIAACGYTGVEIAPFTLGASPMELTTVERCAIRTSVERHSLSIIGLHWLLAKTEGYYLTHPDPTVRHRTAGYLASLAKLCADLGGKILVLGSPKQRSLLPGVTQEQANAYAMDVIQTLVPTLEATDTMLAIEPLSPQETDFWNTAESVIAFAQRVRSPHVQLHLDCKAMSSENKPIPQIIRESAEWTAHFHANDPNLQGPGFGSLDFWPIFQALRETGYQGWVSVEVFDLTPGIDRLATESLQNMRLCANRET